MKEKRGLEKIGLPRTPTSSGLPQRTSVHRRAGANTEQNDLRQHAERNRHARTLKLWRHRATSCDRQARLMLA